MKTTKKAVRKAAKARKQAAAAKIARKESSGIVPPTPAEVGKYAPGGPRPAPDMMPPPVLYKYAPPDTSDVKSIEQVIADRRIYFPNPMKLNDLFDCQVGIDISDPKTEKKWLDILQSQGLVPPGSQAALSDLLASDPRCEEAILRTLRERDRMLFEGMNVGVCCLAEKPDSVLMWAHYARSHQGVCLEIAPYRGGEMMEHPPLKVAWRSDDRAFPFQIIQAVSYDPEHLTCPLGDGPEGYEVFFRKSKDWEHEKEWRALMPPDSSDLPFPSPRQFRGGNRAYPLGENRLTGVILGYRMSPSYKRYVAHMAKEAGIAIREAYPKYSEYGMKIVPYEGDAG